MSNPKKVVILCTMTWKRKLVSLTSNDTTQMIEDLLRDNTNIHTIGLHYDKEVASILIINFKFGIQSSSS